MPNIKVVNMTGVQVGEMALSDMIFGADVNEAVLHAAVRAYLLNQRQGTQSTLTRSEVSGGGRKPWRQKGTGRARQGSTRSPQWTHGGIALGPKPRSYTTKMNKKVKQIALFSALSAKVANNEMIVVDSIAATEFKTKTMVNMLSAIGAGKKSLVVLDGPNAMVVKSLSNISGVKVAYTNTINTYDILNCNTIVFAQAAVEKLQEVYA
jgi:large subunit ribosomal protein L4